MKPQSHAPIVDEEQGGDAVGETDDLTEPGPGRRLGRYELVRLLGSGGMANVYLARAEGPGGFEKLFAVKCIHSFLARDRRFVQMFLDEARISALVSHPNVAQVFELGEDRGIYFLAMELLHGEHLGALHARALRSLGAMPSDFAATIVASAAEGLHQAHETEDAEGRPLSVVHRDVSPQNVFVTYDGLVKVTDFGIAKAANRLVETDTGSVKGKFGYMAPEQALGMTVDRRTDVFALGVVLWELLTGKRLFRATTSAETLLNVTRCEVAKPSSIQPACPPELERIALRALAREPSDRYATAAELAEELARWLRDERRMVERTRLATFVRELFPERAANRPRAGASSQDAALPPPAGASPVPAPQAEPSHSGVRPGSGVVTADAPTALAAPPPSPTSVPNDAASVVAVAPLQPRDDEPIELPRKGPSAAMLVGGATVLVAIVIAAVLVWTRDPHTEPSIARPQRPAPATLRAPSTPSIDRATPTTPAAPPAVVAAAPVAPAGPVVPVVTAAEPAAAAGAQARVHPARSSTPSPITTERWGYLNLITTPWARVWINGQPYGNTPLYRRRVPAGAVSIELRAEGRGPPRTVRLTVGVGETVSRRLDLAQP